MSETKGIDTPVGDFEWCFIDGEGKADLQGKPKFTVDVVLDPEKAKPFKAMVDEFWADNKPKGATKAKSMGYYAHKVKDEAASKEAGENIYTETGKTVVRLNTNTTYVSGDPKVIKIFNSKGNEISLMNKRLGNGSRGRATGVMAIYDFNAAARGVTFYLNALQVSKFVEYVGGANFGALDEDEGDFEGVGETFGGIEDEQVDKPRL